MAKISVNLKPKRSKIAFNRLRIGQLATIVDHKYLNYNGMIVMMTFKYVVSLSDPNRVWEDTCDTCFCIPLEKDESVTLTQ
jgi:hypothetical protein